jgi:2-amino-4-hydroxy-6-hydroxymethyldihydropteridine diphosphokinase
MQAVLSLGSNVGDRVAHLRAGLEILQARFPVLAVSPFYETDPVGGPQQRAFVNCVALVTADSPEALLVAAHDAEEARGRLRRGRWGPRTLDVDIITVDAIISDDPRLTLPHPRAHERAFVLVPWLDVDPVGRAAVVAVRPTRVVVLLAVAVLAGLVGYLLTRSYYADVPSPSAYAPLWLLLLALAEGYTATVTRARLSGRPGTKPVNPIVVARLAALAKATSPVGALAFGAYAGFLAHVAQGSSPQAHTDTRTAALGVGCSLGLAVAALALERVCRVKPPPDE